MRLSMILARNSIEIMRILFARFIDEIRTKKCRENSDFINQDLAPCFKGLFILQAQGSLLLFQQFQVLLNRFTMSEEAAVPLTSF